MDLSLGGTTDGTVVAPEGDTLGVGLDVLEELDRLDEGEAGGSGRGLAGVLVVNTEVGTAGDTDRLAVLDEVRRRVLGLREEGETS